MLHNGLHVAPNSAFALLTYPHPSVCLLSSGVIIMSSMDDVIKYAKQEQQHPMDPEIALQVLTADNGKLVRQLDTAAHGGTPDQNISKNDIL
ncbi:MAG TPA: hypothetical protein V6C72_06085, partial [Chroococcales cyanobacterium]